MARKDDSLSGYWYKISGWKIGTGSLVSGEGGVKAHSTSDAIEKVRNIARVHYGCTLRRLAIHKIVRWATAGAETDIEEQPLALISFDASGRPVADNSDRSEYKSVAERNRAEANKSHSVTKKALSDHLDAASWVYPLYDPPPSTFPTITPKGAKDDTENHTGC